VLISFASLLFDMEDYVQAEHVFKECVKIYKQSPGLTVKAAVETYEGLIRTLRTLNKEQEVTYYESELNNFRN
jgi:hypothetical protein